METKPNKRCPHFNKNEGACDLRVEGAVYKCLGKPSDGPAGCFFLDELEQAALSTAALTTAVSLTRKPTSSQPPQATSK